MCFTVDAGFARLHIGGFFVFLVCFCGEFILSKRGATFLFILHKNSNLRQNLLFPDSTASGIQKSPIEIN
jgi:hypothetical protein